MSELKVTFTLGEKDVAHLRRLMRKAMQHAAGQSETAVLGATQSLAKEVRAAKPPRYVIERVEKLELLVQMVQDEDYAIPMSVRKKVLGALAYFAQPADLIPDSIPGLGFLDDAIMVELISQDLRNELWGYARFVDYRDSAEQKPWTRVGQTALKEKLSGKRRQIRAEIQKRAARDAERARSGGRFLKALW
jgi:uncharacterized membrane protein YkvA (DUF1232 family)